MELTTKKTPKGKAPDEGAPHVTIDGGQLAWAFGDSCENGLELVLEPRAETCSLDLA